jgi:hypothetical protein
MINVNKIGDSITGSVKGQNFGIAFSEEKYAKMIELAQKSTEVETVEEFNAIVEEFLPLTKESFADTVETACPYIHINRATGKYFLKNNGIVSKVPMPESFVDRILVSIEKDIDVMPLIKFWTRLLRNPYLTPSKTRRICNYIAKTYVDYEMAAELINTQGVSEPVAYQRATTLQTPITKEGLLCTYKVSREVKTKYVLDENNEKQVVDRYPSTSTIDENTGEVTTTTEEPLFMEERIFQPAVMHTSGDAFECDGVLGHIIKVGSRIVLPEWSQVDRNDDHSCVKGLHVGNLDYIKGYHTEGVTEKHYIFVDPMFIGAITDDGSGALRVKEYYVYGTFTGVTKSIYHSSTYAAMTDAEWEKMRKEAIETADKIRLDMEATLEEGLATVNSL